jgi:hypothetical protein
MISSLLFFLVGLTIFIVKSQIKTEGKILRLLLFLISGAVSGAIVGLVTGSPLQPLMDIPWTGTALVGAIAGSLLFAAEKWSLFIRPGIRYFTSIILGLSLAGLTYLLCMLYKADSMHYISPNQRTYIVLVILFIGFLIIFGYAFPERRFRQKRPPEKDTDG